MFLDLHLLRPTNVAEVVTELKFLGDAAKVYAGGAELLLLLRHRLLQVDYLIDIKGIGSLGTVSWDGTAVRLGSTVTHRQLEKDSLVREMIPTFAYAESQVANVRVRNHGTLGGNLCFNDPHSDPGTVLLIYEAAVTVVGSGGERQMPLGEFLKGMYETALEPDELLVEVEVPPLPVGWGSAYLRVHRQQRPTLGVAVAAKVERERLAAVRLAVGCVGPAAKRLTELENSVQGSTVKEAGRAVESSGSYLRNVLEPVDDLLGSAEYKLYMARVLLRRALDQSVRGNGRSQSEQ